MTKTHTNTVIDPTTSVLSKDGTTISYLSMTQNLQGFPAIIEKTLCHSLRERPFQGLSHQRHIHDALGVFPPRGKKSIITPIN